MKELIVIGDRVLLIPEEGEERTPVGLYLPRTAVDARQVQGGRVMALGPGIPVAQPDANDDEPWKRQRPTARYWPFELAPGRCSSCQPSVR
jgi:hypothetical protein